MRPGRCLMRPARERSWIFHASWKVAGMGIPPKNLREARILRVKAGFLSRVSGKHSSSPTEANIKHRVRHPNQCRNASVGTCARKAEKPPYKMLGRIDITDR